MDDSAVENEVILRIAEPDDTQSIMLLLKTYYSEMALNYPKIDKGDCMEWILRTIRHGGSVVAILKGRVIGSVGCAPYEFSYNRRFKYIMNEWFTVHPKYRNLGIASKMLEHCKGISDKKSEIVGENIPFMFSISSGKDKRLDRFIEMSGFQYAGGLFMYGLNVNKDTTEH